MKDFIPSDLWSFLTGDRQLSWDFDTLETGALEFLPSSELRIGRIYAAAHSSSDPNHGTDGVYRIPAISLVKSCERYDPTYVLSYLPFEKMYASFDGDHARVTLFPGASWTRIVAKPAPFLNALWQASPSVECSREQPWWERYVFFADAFE